MAANRIYNFSAGPAILPPEVMTRAAEAVRELRAPAHAADGEGIGLSILEISHRSPEFTAINERANDLCHEVLGIPRSHQVLFLQGGASLQFVMVPMNLGRAGKSNCFIDTGAWSAKAIKESKLRAETKVLASSKETIYDHIPAFPEIPGDAAYLHVTTNNTIYGTEWADVPEAGDTPVVIDCSSHIGSRPMALGRAAIGFAGAQKNLGPSGVTLCFVNKDLIGEVASDDVPLYMRYETHAKNPSVYNTPNTFGILVLQLVLEWVQELGGVEGMEQRNRAKAGKLYSCLDESSLFAAHAKEPNRSLMNVPWTLAGAADADRDALTAKFLAEAKAAGLSGLKGHRSVGGCRASIYNAFPPEGVDVLVEFMREFERSA